MGIEGVNYKKEDNLRFSEIPGTDATRNYALACGSMFVCRFFAHGEKTTHKR